MKLERDLTQLSTVLPDFAPRLLPIGGELRLNLTIDAGHGLEVSHVRGDYYALRSVHMSEAGSDNILVAVVYGLALIPNIVKTYAAVHAAGRKAVDND